MGNRRINKNNSYIAIIGTIAIMAIIGCLSFIKLTPIDSKTPIYNLTFNFRDTGEYSLPQEFSYKDEGPEYLYAKGLEKFANGDEKTAKELFLEAEAKLDEAEDKALPFYLYCYLNKCETDTYGIGNMDFVDKAINAALEYHPVLNDHSCVWEALYSVAVDTDSDMIVLGYLDQILEFKDELIDDATIRYSNCSAMLEFFDGNYAKSVRSFYDVKEMYKDVKMNKFLQGQMLFTNSYIALFYYEFKDYEMAIEEFTNNIAVHVDDPVINAERKYSDYINLSSSYLDVGDTENAIKTLEGLEEIMPYVGEDLKDSIYASIYDNYANAAIMDGDYEKAKEYIKKTKETIATSDEVAFYGNEVYTKLTEAKLYMAQKNNRMAREILEYLRDSGDAQYVGIETEVYELLLDVYEVLGDAENYYYTLDSLRNAEVIFNQTIIDGYMEFSKYYEKAEMLSKENQILEENKKITNIVIGSIVFALLMALLAIILIRQSLFIDTLTGIKNRKALHAYSKKHEDKGIPSKTCIIMLDIDYFKKYNDTYGHIAGDGALRQVALSIKESIRRRDFLIRYGGEEFLIILENLDIEMANSICNRIVKNVQDKKLEHISSDVSDVVTVSLGMCMNNEDGTNLDDLLHKADEALYRAKSSGRNRVSD